MEDSVEDISATENILSTPGSNTYAIRGIMNQDTSVIENIDEDIMEIAPVPSPEAFFEKVDMTTQDITMTQNLVATPGPSAEGIGERVDQIADVKIETREATFIPNTEGIIEIVDQETDGINATGNSEATPGPSVEVVHESMNLTMEDFKVTENLKATPVSSTEVFTEILDLYEVIETGSLIIDLESSPERIDEIMDNETTKDISVMENLEAIPVPNTERIGEINDKIAEGFDVTENSEATPVSNKGVNEIHVQDENTTTDTVFNKEMSNTENESENETSKTMNNKAENLKIVCERKTKNLKRKISHPSISEMLMGCIKSLKKSSGVSFEDIKTRMEENYSVEVKALLKYHVINYLQKWVEIGILEKVKEADLGERFRIKESEISYEKDCIIQAKKLKIN